MLKIRFKRGTAAQNDALVLNIGALSIDEENLSVRVHDGTTPGGHSLGSLGSIDSISDRLESLGLEDVDGLVIALASKIAVTELGQVLGVAQLNPEGVIPTEQLPSYVEDIIEIADLESLPNNGEVGKLYVVRTTNELYRWSGTQETYYQISGSLETTDDLSQGQVNFYFTEPRMRSSLNVEGDLSYDPDTGVLSYSSTVVSVQGREGDVALDKSDVGLGLVENYPTADEEELEVAESGEHYVTALGARIFAEAMGFSDAEGQWAFNPANLPFPELQGVWTRLADGPYEGDPNYAVNLNGKMHVIYGGIKHTVYDPATDVWTDLPDLSEALSGSWVDIDGKIYVHGGTGTGDLNNELRVLDLATGNITQLSSGGPAFYAHSLTALNGNIYVFGGETSIRNNPVRDNLFVYSPLTDTWTTLTSAPVGRSHHSAVALNGKMYIYGGYDGRRGSSNSRVVSETLYVYDPLEDSWESKASSPEERRGSSLVVLNGKIYAYGGWTTNSYAANPQLFEYSPKSNQWTLFSTAPNGLSTRGNSMVVIKNKIYFYGGNRPTNRYFNSLYMLE